MYKNILKYDNGIILIDKKEGYTSQDVCSVLKGMLHVNKIGHTGTLDKEATGLLVCLLGNATKYQDYFKDEKKLYEGELVLGISTDTDDIYGKIYKEDDNINIEKSKIENIYRYFIGKIKQIPPMYSAKKIEGRSLLFFARKGKTIDRKASDIIIDEIKSIGDIYEKEVNGKKYKTLKMSIRCSKGTYIRALCRDMGEKLNIPACMGCLRRIESDGFNINNAYNLEEIKNKIENKDFTFLRVALYNKVDQVVTFGKYDCLHLGHRKIIDRVVSEAKKRNIESSVLTFSINPKEILNKENINYVITKEQRISYLKLYGINNILEFPFNEMTKNIDGDIFVKEILIKQMKAKMIVVGDDCRYGKGGACDAKHLKDICEKMGVDVIIIDRLHINDVISQNENNGVITSTYIRELIKNGETEKAEKLMGHKI